MTTPPDSISKPSPSPSTKDTSATLQKPGRSGLDASAVLDHWRRFQRIPGGKYLFAQLLGFFIPYTGSIKPRVHSLEPGHAVVHLHDRRRVRNHLRSVHAIALANLAELTTGLATLSGMPEDARGILTGLDVQYTKKARGIITGTCTCEFPETSERQEYKIPVTLTDEQGDVVVTATATWLTGPKTQG